MHCIYKLISNYYSSRYSNSFSSVLNVERNDFVLPPSTQLAPRTPRSFATLLFEN